MFTKWQHHLTTHFSELSLSGSCTRLNHQENNVRKIGDVLINQQRGSSERPERRKIKKAKTQGDSGGPMLSLWFSYKYVNVNQPAVKFHIKCWFDSDCVRIFLKCY